MKKLLIILLATVLLAGLTPQAQAALQAVGPVTAPAAVPDWYQDTQGLQLVDCLDPGFCLVVDLTAGAEGFYWAADAALPAPLNGILTLALEITRPNITFARIRIRFDTDVTGAGNYTVTHPFGKITLTGLAAAPSGGNVTQDIGLVAGNFNLPLANDPAQSGTVNTDGRSIGPFLIPADAPFVRDAATGNIYIANPGLLHTVTGSPLGTNFFRVEGPGLPAGGLTQTLFTLQGKVANCVAPAVNTAPVAVAEPPIGLAAGQAKIVNVIANDTDNVGVNRAAITITVPPTRGTAVKNLDGTVTYTPNPGFSGTDAFSYTVQDYCMVPSNAVVDNVMVEQLIAGKADFRVRTGKWSVTGSSNFSNVPLPAPGQPNLIRLHKGAPNGPVIGTVPVQANGSWRFQGKSKVSPGAVPQTIHVESGAGVVIDKPLKIK